MIYLNNAATSYPKAPGTSAAVRNALESLPGHGNRASWGYEEAADCRTLLAELFKIDDKDRIVHTANATQALNIALLGIEWHEGDVVLTTASEHNSVLRPLHFLKCRGIVDYHVLPVGCDGRLDENVLEAAMKTYRPRLLAFTHASNVTGALNNAERLTAIAKSYDSMVLLDASQTAGICPVYPQRWNVDIMAFTGHKYLLGPQGTGGLYVAGGICLTPVYTGGTGIYSDMDEMPEQMPVRLEAGTGNEHSLEGLRESLLWLRQNNADEQRLRDMLSYLENGLAQAGYQVVAVAGERTPVISFFSEQESPEDIGDMLSGSYEIICRTGLHCAPHIFTYLGCGAQGTVRISLSRFTTWEEVRYFIQAVEDIAGE